MGRELEFRYSFSGHGELDRIRYILQSEFPGGWERIHMYSSYYDTASRDLTKRQIMLRLRAENQMTVLTCKTPRKDGSREEWEVRGGTLPEGLLALVRKGAPEILMNLYHIPMHSLCSARYTRVRRIAQLPGAEAELALDTGVLCGGFREKPFWELEVELQSGDGEAMRQWCSSFSETYGLEEEPKTKFARTIALLV